MKDFGFTFLEVMIAVAIIAIAFVALIGSQSQSVSVAAGIRSNVTASFLAQQKLADLESADFDTLYSSEGVFEDDFSQFGWKTEINTLTADETGIEGSDNLLKTIDLSITRSGSGEAIYTLRSIVAKKIVPSAN